MLEKIKKESKESDGDNTSKNKSWFSWLWQFNKKPLESTKKLVNSETTKNGLRLSAKWFGRITNILLIVFVIVALAKIGWAYWNNTNQDAHTIAILICLTAVVLSFDNGKSLYKMKKKAKWSRYFGAFVVSISALWGTFVLCSYFDLRQLHESLTDKNVFTVNFSAFFIMLGLLQFSIHEQNSLRSIWPKWLYYPISAARTSVIAYGIWKWERYNIGNYIALISVLIVVEFALYMLIFRRYREVADDDDDEKPVEKAQL